MSKVDIYSLTEGDDLQAKLIAWASDSAQTTSGHNAPYDNESILREKRKQDAINTTLLHIQLQRIHAGFKGLKDNIEKFGQEIEHVNQLSMSFNAASQDVNDALKIAEEYKNKGGLNQLYHEQYAALDALDGSQDGLWAGIEENILKLEDGTHVYLDEKTGELYSVEIRMNEQGQESLARVYITDSLTRADLYTQIFEDGKIVANKTAFSQDPTNNLTHAHNAWGQSFENTGLDIADPDVQTSATLDMETGAVCNAMSGTATECKMTADELAELADIYTEEINEYELKAKAIEDKISALQDRPHSEDEINALKQELNEVNQSIEISRDNLKTTKDSILNKGQTEKVVPIAAAHADDSPKQDNADHTPLMFTFKNAAMLDDNVDVSSNADHDSDENDAGNDGLESFEISGYDDGINLKAQQLRSLANAALYNGTTASLDDILRYADELNMDIDANDMADINYELKSRYGLTVEMPEDKPAIPQIIGDFNVVGSAAPTDIASVAPNMSSAFGSAVSNTPPTVEQTPQVAPQEHTMQPAQSPAMTA